MGKSVERITFDDSRKIVNVESDAQKRQFNPKGQGGKVCESVGVGRRPWEPRIDDNDQMAVYLGNKPGDDNAACI